MRGSVRNGHLAPSMLVSWHGPREQSFQLLVLTSLEYYSYSHNHVANTLFNKHHPYILRARASSGDNGHSDERL